MKEKKPSKPRIQSKVVKVWKEKYLLKGIDIRYNRFGIPMWEMRSSNSRFITYQCAVPIKDITKLETNVELFKKEYPRVQLQDKKKETKSVVTGEKITGVIYVCYEENSTELYNDAGNLNHMFVTADVAQALDWAKRSLSNAEANNYLPITDDEMKQFISEIGMEQYASV